MYLGLDFLLAPGPEAFLVEANVGLPGGAHEYDLAHRIFMGRPSGVFERIESLSRRAYGLSFRAYIDSLPFLESLKAMKLWMDGQGAFPEAFHPALRFEDKWVQYRFLSPHVPMPRTVPLDRADPDGARRFLKTIPEAVVKRRTGRGGRGFALVGPRTGTAGLFPGPLPCLLQEHIDSRVEGYSLSVRSVAFAGEPVAMYANLAAGRPVSNHGILAFVVPGTFFGLTETAFRIHAFDERSWEAAIWFGQDPARDPAYLRHNLNEERVAAAALVLPAGIYEGIRKASVMVERLYEGTDPASLPEAWFEAP